MALITAQLLFARREDDRALVDVVVLDREEAPASPPVGAPLCFVFAFPKDPAWCDVLEGRLLAWAEQSATVTIDLRHHFGRTTVRIASAGRAVTLHPLLV